MIFKMIFKVFFSQRAGQMTQWSRMLASLPVNPSLVSSTHIAWLTVACNSSSVEWDTIICPMYVHIPTHKHKCTYTHIKINSRKTCCCHWRTYMTNRKNDHFIKTKSVWMEKDWILCYAKIILHKKVNLWLFVKAKSNQHVMYKETQIF